MASELWTALIDIENQLGWSPAEEPREVYRARAVAHRILTRAMTKQNLAVADLRLAMAYAKTKRLMIESPLQLLALVNKARELASTQTTASNLDERVRSAISWELDNATEESDAERDYWYLRLVRAAGPTRAGLLREWQEAGRGPGGNLPG